MMITGLYAGILGLVFVILSARVILCRVKNRVSLGDGGNADLACRIRIQGNFAEYVPIALILIGILDAGHSAPWILHALGMLLIIGRLIHAYALTANSFTLRKIGMIITFSVIVIASVLALAAFLPL